MVKQPKIGRPRKRERDKIWTPPRQIGRVNEETWQLLLRAIELSGETKTEWMLKRLKRAAAAEIRKHVQSGK